MGGKKSGYAGFFHLPGQSALSTNQCPTSERDKEEMKKVPYASAVGSLMYDVHKARHLSCSWRGQSVSPAKNIGQQ